MTLTGYIVGAKGNTGRGISGITENNDYTITISFTDGTTFTTEPIPGFTSVDLDENYDLVVTKTDGTEVTVETGLGEYNATLSGYKTDAENAATSASQSKTAAAGSAGTATAQATLARSYAKGDTSSRTGEATDNAEYFKGQASESATSASSSASTAEAQALISEGYAQGTQVSTPVTSDSPYYHNNSKYFSEQASASATSAASSATSASSSASSASASATSASSSASTASSASTSATNAKTAAQTAAEAAANSKSDAEAFAKGTRNGTPVSSGDAAYENNSKYFAEQAGDYAESLDPDTIARIDGYYDTLGAGTAEQLTSNIYEEDNIPYNFRTSGGSIDIGDRETDMVVGGTVAWNQLAKQFVINGSTMSMDGNTCTTTHNGESRAFFGVGVSDGVSYVYKPLANHKYFWSVNITNISVANLRFITFANGFTGPAATIGFSTVGIHRGISKGVGNTSLYFNANMSEASTSTADTFSFKDMMLIDLTAMFGTTIADYIYNLEQSQAGAGVAWFRKLFPKPYYAYNAGELMSVQAVSHNMVGFNAFDNSILVQTNSVRVDSDYIPVVPNTTYYFRQDSTIPGTYVTMHDANKSSLGNDISKYDIKNFLFTTTADTHYIKMGWFDSNGCSVSRIVNNNVNINISWDGERDGEYEEYVKHSYALDSDLVLRGIPKLDNGNLYYDGDTYESDGAVTRKRHQIILDNTSSNWTFTGTGTSGGKTFFTLTINSPFRGINSSVAGERIVASNYFVEDGRGVAEGNFYLTGDGLIFVFVLQDQTITTVEDARAWLTNHPFTVEYTLATTTEESADPYTNPQIVNDFGTEEYVDYPYSQGTRDVAIPVGHQTQYMANLKAKLEMSPSSPEGAGDYIVRQTNGENEYVTLASNATIQNIIARLEALEGGGE